MPAPFLPIVRDVTHRLYCGPYAVAALTGVPVARIEKMLRHNRKGHRDNLGRRLPVRGVCEGEVLLVLERLGCKVTEYKMREQCTFAGFCADTALVQKPYLVSVAGHVMVAYRGQFTDSANHDELAPVKHGLRRVQKAWAIDAPAAPMYTLADPIAPPPRPRKPKPDIRVVRMQRLAEQIARWESKEKRARTALKKLRPKLARYKRLGLNPQEATHDADHPL